MHFSRVRVTEILSEKMSAAAGAGAGGVPHSRISGWVEGAKGAMEHGRKGPMRGSRITTTLLG